MTDSRQTENAAPGGTGAADGSAECPRCGGHGVISNSLEQTAKDCPMCRGDGVVPDALYAPCPFCGQTVGYIASHDGYRVACDPCDIYGPRGVDYADARVKWNHRASAGVSRDERPHNER